MHLDIRRFVRTTLAVVLSAAAAAAASAELNLGDRPLFLTEGVDPNFFITLDNSDSMNWGYLPDQLVEDDPLFDEDDLAGSLLLVSGTRRVKSSHYNRIYYDPDQVYLAPLYFVPSEDEGEDPVAVEFPTSGFASAAPTNPFASDCLPAGGAFPVGCPDRIDLSGSYAMWWGQDFINLDPVYGDDPDPEPAGADGSIPRPAYYYVFDADNPDCDGTDPDHDGTDLDQDDACYTRVKYGDAGFDADRFARWYSYYHTRLLVTKTAASRSLVDVDEDVRVGYQAINGACNRYLLPRPFSDDYRAADPDRSDICAGHGVTGQKTGFYSWLFDLETAGSTPLIAATDRVGQSLTEAAPYLEDPDDAGSFRTCRTNFHLLFTDGAWRDGEGRSPNPFAGNNVDGSDHRVPRASERSAYDVVVDYEPAAPYSDGNVGVLADAAFHYWVTDLWAGIGDRNDVPRYISRRSLTVADTFDPEATYWDPVNDPATWQHLVNYSIGLGVSGVIEEQLEGYPFDDVGLRDAALVAALQAGDITCIDDDGVAKTGWDCGNKIDDLWHMAINSRGTYFSAGNPAELEAALDSLFPPPSPSTLGGGLSVALNSGTLTTESALYQATFSAGTWTGQVKAIEICSGEVFDDDGDRVSGCEPPGSLGEELWDTIDTFGDDLNHATRDIFTFDAFHRDEDDVLSGQAVVFDADSLSAEAMALLDPTSDGNDENRLAYLRGDNSMEQRMSGGIFRDRIEVGSDQVFVTNLLGDILGSPPVYVGAPRRFFPDALEAADYASFRTGAAANRTKMVYFGANDGMLHGVKAAGVQGGAEVFAYIPSPVFANLHLLSRPDYAHANYVDGPVSEGDVFDGAVWRSMIAGGLGHGGQGVYLLDVTAPSSVTAGNLLEWEFTDADDPDLGYTYGRPQFIKRPDPVDADADYDNGPWAVAFGNGYNNTEDDGHSSDDGAAAIYLVNVSRTEGDLVTTKIRTVDGDSVIGTAADPLEEDRPNAIAFITPVDLDADFDADLIYAGDLFGNLWRFDIDRTTAEGNRATRIFTAAVSLAADPGHQPITTPVRVVRHPTGSGLLVLFGTGKYLETGVDIVNTDVQTFYGIWDTLADSPPTIVRDNLLEQEIETHDFSSEGVTFDVRVVTNRALDRWGADDEAAPTEYMGWFIDLPEEGERVHQAPLVRGDRVIFVTVTPDDDPCRAGGSSWAMEVETKDGSSLEDISPFDFTENGAYDVLTAQPGGEGGEVFYGAGIRLPESGIYSAPTALVISGQEERKYINTSKGQVIVLGETTGLNLVRPWREIR